MEGSRFGMLNDGLFLRLVGVSGTRDDSEYCQAGPCSRGLIERVILMHWDLHLWSDASYVQDLKLKHFEGELAATHLDGHNKTARAR